MYRTETLRSGMPAADVAICCMEVLNDHRRKHAFNDMGRRRIDSLADFATVAT